MKHLENIAATLFGILFLILGFAVAVETLMRKVLNKSLQGVDELGGYILATGAALAFVVALAGRAHIRIDIVHDHLPRALRVVLNVLSLAALTVTAFAVFWMGWIALSDSKLFNATAQTPWATPLAYPQTAWVIALGIFVLACLFEWVRLGSIAAREGIAGIDRRAGPRTSREELQEELEDLKARGGLAAIDDGDRRP
jgi:TRAP-type C4-dicarboxylate transport system permease small subunit